MTEPVRFTPDVEHPAERDALEGLQVHGATLEDVFLNLTGRSLREAENGRSTDETRSPAA